MEKIMKFNEAYGRIHPPAAEDYLSYKEKSNIQTMQLNEEEESLENGGRRTESREPRKRRLLRSMLILQMALYL
ncbi:hypothetical protein C5167_010563 [Papaver somniferum]|uniref:Uncharacterized protein n=1 Tax=Papaver somniferum TaxID=3469 RepID=A0A4Y7K0L7_PAPSO|nr:hypothetical protein C5167_010563 [Papaver somniferum]